MLVSNEFLNYLFKKNIIIISICCYKEIIELYDVKILYKEKIIKKLLCETQLNQKLIIESNRSKHKNVLY